MGPQKAQNTEKAHTVPPHLHNIACVAVRCLRGKR